MHLTLKLRSQKDDRTFIVGCRSVDIAATGAGYIVSATDSEGGVIDYEVSPQGEFDIGYVENNLSGATTHIIKPKVKI